MPEKITDIQKARQSKRQKMSLMLWLQVEIWLRLWMKKSMIKKINRPDPTTEEGRAEINTILKRRKAEAEEFRKIAFTDVDEEPKGKLTIPSDIDLHRDRKENDD